MLWVFLGKGQVSGIRGHVVPRGLGGSLISFARAYDEFCCFAYANPQGEDSGEERL